MNRKFIFTLVGLCVVGLVGGAIYVRGNKPTATPVAAANPVVELLAADIASAQPILLSQALIANGSIKPLRQAVVKSQVSAIVLTVNVQEGQEVKAGALLATTDVQDYQSRVAAQQALVAQANAQVAIAQRTVDNNKSLVEKGFILPSAYEAATQQLDANIAAVAAANANLAVSKKALEDTKIRAPIAGVVTEKLIAEGDKASPDMKIFTITAPGAVEFEGTLPVAEAAQIKRGQSVLITVEGAPSKDGVRSTISRINAAVNAGTRTVSFYAALPANSSLTSGSFANAKILVQSATTLAVPTAALREEAGRNTVYTLNGTPETLQSTIVKTGLRGENETGESYIAVEGLPAGTRYVSRNLGPLRVGSTAKVAK